MLKRDVEKLMNWLYDQQFNYEDSGKQMITEILEVLKEFKTMEITFEQANCFISELIEKYKEEKQTSIPLQPCDCCGKELTQKNIKPICKECFPYFD